MKFQKKNYYYYYYYYYYYLFSKPILQGQFLKYSQCAYYFATDKVEVSEKC